jgi:hypothetical protein
MHAEEAYHTENLAVALYQERMLPCARWEAAAPLRPHRMAKIGLPVVSLPLRPRALCSVSPFFPQQKHHLHLGRPAATRRHALACCCC